MKAGSVFTAILVVAVSAVAVRLGFWQLARLEEKRQMNWQQNDALSNPPTPITNGSGRRIDPLRGRLVLAGRFDSRFHVLLRGRSRDGALGVEVVTPFVLADDSTAVLVNRGWVPAADAATLAVGEIPADTSHEVIGFVAGFGVSSTPIPAMREMGDAVTRLWSAPRLDRDSLAARLPYALADWQVIALPGAGAPATPTRAVPQPYDEATHLGYALQWFAIAILVPAGAWILARRRRRA